jgi:hypothetical protein
MEDLIIKSNDVEFMSTNEAYDSFPKLRAYCTQYPKQFKIQIRGCVPLYTDKVRFKREKDLVHRNLIASISLSAEEILQLAEYVKNTDKRNMV